MPIKKLASEYFNEKTGKAIALKYTDFEFELPHLVSLYHDINVLNITYYSYKSIRLLKLFNRELLRKCPDYYENKK